jgi:quercetin dioxygenase-like cupin family protein
MIRTMTTLALGAILGAGGLSLLRHEGATVKPLMAEDVAEKIDGKAARVSMSEVSWGPGASSAPHRHPGAVFGYVLEGVLETQLAGQPLKTLKAGDSFYEPTMALHAVSRNPSKTAATRVLVVMVHPRDAEHLVIPEKPKD